MSVISRLENLLNSQILILDGAMGTMIQQYKLHEAHYRGAQFEYWHKDLKGNNDLLCLTQPHIIKEIHIAYLEAGAHIIETNTFNAQAVSLADYDMQAQSYPINKAAATIAKDAIATYCSQTGSDPDSYFVAGAIGPMNKTLSLSPDVNNPGYRAITFDEVADAYYEQIDGLMAGGADILLVETIFDTLNAKAALVAVHRYFEDHSEYTKPPIMLSGTITDASGRTLSGQTLDAFLISVAHAKPVSIGLNCALGARQMQPHIEEMSQKAACYVSAYPNAGLPNALGEYDETPAQTAEIITQWAQNGWINIVGGCCGTTPSHIKAIAQAVKHIAPRGVGEAVFS
ncbi:MAG: 5-methyltetrahydrofolate--homocysteine methyltransferase [Chitinophagia bacterium]|nr:5-methyltetrahydrofolate--homocysteine methyltransferase [Chitinophagia bacterium]